MPKKILESILKLKEKSNRLYIAGDTLRNLFAGNKYPVYHILTDLDKRRVCSLYNKLNDDEINIKIGNYSLRIEANFNKSIEDYFSDSLFKSDMMLLDLMDETLYYNPKSIILAKNKILSFSNNIRNRMILCEGVLLMSIREEIENGLKLDKRSRRILKRNSSLLSVPNLSDESILEFKNILTSYYCKIIFEEYDDVLINLFPCIDKLKYVIINKREYSNLYDKTLKVIELCSSNIYVKVASLFINLDNAKEDNLNERRGVSGVESAFLFCKKINLSREEIEDVCFLVENWKLDLENYDSFKEKLKQEYRGRNFNNALNMLGELILATRRVEKEPYVDILEYFKKVNDLE